MCNNVLGVSTVGMFSSLHVSLARHIARKEIMDNVMLKAAACKSIICQRIHELAKKCLTSN